jgi:tetratricopeptide (TPR) repeat protein
VPLLESALARDPEHKEVLYLLSECYSHSPRYADPRRAAQLMETLLRLDPDFHVVYNHLSNAYVHLGEFQRARAKLDEWEAKEPETVRVTRAQLSAYEGDLDEGLRLTEPAQGRTEILWRSRFALAAGRWDIVRSMLEKLEGPGKPRGPRARLHTFLGEFARAEAIHREASAKPETGEGIPAGLNILARHSLAELRWLRGEMRAAYGEAERALEVQPDGPYCLYMAGRLAAQAADVAAAERHLRTLEAVARTARGPLVPYYRDALAAEIALAGGRPLEAQTLLENALASGTVRYDGWIFEPRPVFRDSLARAYLASGAKEQAARVFESMVNSGMDRVPHPVLYVRALYTLGMLKLDLGDRAEGRELLRKFLTLWGKADWDLREVRDARARLASIRALS